MNSMMCSGSATSNMLPKISREPRKLKYGVREFKDATEFSREQRKLSWQPKLGKNKPKF